MASFSSYSDILSESDVSYIMSLPEVEVARNRVLSRNVVYFTVELTPEIKSRVLSQMGLDLSEVSKVPMRWIRGDTRPHIDSGDVFDNTYLVYLTDSEGSLILDGESFPISKSTGFVFNEGLNHETVGTGNEPRLLLGPMSEHGVPVGFAGIFGAGGTTVYLRQNGSDVEYSQDDQETWNVIGWPYGILNTDTSAGYLKVVLTTDLTLSSVNAYWIVSSENIQFGSESLKVDGTLPVIYIDGVANYEGFIKNGDSVSNGYTNIRVYNLEVRATNESTLVTGGGWFGQSYYARNAGQNYIINCHSDGDISSNSGGIIGEASAHDGGYVAIIGCSSSGNQVSGESTQGGGIAGYRAAWQGEILVESCYTTGTISGGECGGILGTQSGDNGTVTVRNCYTTGVIGDSGCGGISGRYTGINGGEVNIVNCYTTGNILYDNSGGIVGGDCDNVNVTNCYTTGNINSGDGSGGICGSNATINITKCYVTGTATSNGFFIGGSSDIPANCYSEADNSSSGWNTTNADSVLDGTPDPIGSVWVSTGVNQPYELLNMGYSPYTINNISNNSLVRMYSTLTLGNEPRKDMADIEYTDEFDPNSFQGQFFPGMADFVDGNIVAGDKASGDRLIASYWDDLGDDVFDDWGYFYLYDVDTGKYYFPLISPQNQADGIITTQNVTAFGRNFTIKHGWTARGIFKFEITVADSLGFRFGAYGNMGSDGDEFTEDLTYAYTIGGASRTLYYHHHEEDGDDEEKLWSYFIPKNQSENTSQPYDAYYDSDDMSIVSKELTTGLTVYFAKTVDVKEWVVEQLKVEANEGENSIAPGDSTPAALISGLTYSILEVLGGDEGSHETITINSTTGVISTTSSTVYGNYYLYIRNSGSYHISQYLLSVSGTSEPEPEIVSYKRPAGTLGYDLILDRLSVKGQVYTSIATAPSTATSAGNKGDVRFSDGYIYVCIAPNTWKRAAIATW